MAQSELSFPEPIDQSLLGLFEDSRYLVFVFPKIPTQLFQSIIDLKHVIPTSMEGPTIVIWPILPYFLIHNIKHPACVWDVGDSKA